MKKRVTGAAVIGILLWGGTPYAHGQKTTEIYIPLGQSPGLSGKVTVIGTIEVINAQDQTIKIAGPSGPVSAQVTGRTKIWLDKSYLGLTNAEGGFADLQKGRMVEVKYEGRERRDKGPVEWIKVKVAEPSEGATRQ